MNVLACFIRKKANDSIQFFSFLMLNDLCSLFVSISVAAYWLVLQFRAKTQWEGLPRWLTQVFKLNYVNETLHAVRRNIIENYDIVKNTVFVINFIQIVQKSDNLIFIDQVQIAASQNSTYCAEFQTFYFFFILFIQFIEIGR